MRAFEIVPGLLPATGEDTVGPYYPHAFADGDRRDLSRLHWGLAVRPRGKAIVLSGRILDVAGVPVAPVLIEFWQADANGRFRTPHNAGDPALDPYFDGYARHVSDNGRYELTTIKPGAAPARDSADRDRAPHVTLHIFCDGISRLVTQIFFDDESENDRDPLLASLPPALGDRLVAHRSGERDGVAHYELDLVLQGERETPFFDDLAEMDASERLGSGRGRRMQPGPTDRSAEARVPGNRLHLIPRAARTSFIVNAAPLPGVAARENDLTTIAPGRPRATGETLVVEGTVRNRLGRPLNGLLVELWNANCFGRYTHVDDPGTEPLDPNFLGHGRALTDDAGTYRFTTIAPAPYLARPDIGRWRPPHLHFSIRGGPVRLVTQMYFEGDPRNPNDPMFVLLGDAQARALGRETNAPAGVDRAFRFDIVVPGPHAAYFDQR